jgi:hypothetical protein
MNATTQECILGLKQALAAAGFMVLNPATADVDDWTYAAVQVLTNAQAAQALRGGSGLVEGAQQLGACAAARTALTLRAPVPGQLASLIAAQRALLAPPPAPPAASSSIVSSTTAAYVGLGALALAAIGGLYFTLRR